LDLTSDGAFLDELMDPPIWQMASTSDILWRSFPKKRVATGCTIWYDPLDLSFSFVLWADWGLQEMVRYYHFEWLFVFFFGVYSVNQYQESQMINL
jgi:hypothetical protein